VDYSKIASAERGGDGVQLPHITGNVKKTQENWITVSLSRKKAIRTIC
jgi:hypothetical protein